MRLVTVKNHPWEEKGNIKFILSIQRKIRSAKKLFPKWDIFWVTLFHSYFLMIERLPHKWSIISFKMVKRALQIWRKWVIGRRIRVVLHFKWDSQKFGLSIQKCNRKECRKVYKWKWFYLPSYIESYQWVKNHFFVQLLVSYLQSRPLLSECGKKL